MAFSQHQHQHQHQQHAQFYGQQDFQLMQASQLGNRASLLSGLRMGGPDTSSSSSGGYGQQVDLMRIHTQGDASQMKANAAIFTPNTVPSRQQSPLPSAQQPGGYGCNGNDNHRASMMQGNLEDQLAAMRLRVALSRQGASFGGPDIAANAAGANYAQQDHQQQILQQQLVARQQIELLRLQQQQQHQQQAAAHQRYLLAQIHAEYERQAQVSALQGSLNHGSPQPQPHQQLYAQQQQQQQQQQRNGGGGGAGLSAASAQEQRQAAQASIQASLRQRQAQHAYLQQTMASYEEEQRLQQQQQQKQQQQQLALDEHFSALTQQHAQVLALKQQQQQQQSSASSHHGRNQSDGSARVPLEQRSWRTGAGIVADRHASPPLDRVGSPQVGQGQGQGRERTISGTAESVASWRSRTMTPTIVIDDSASEGSRSAAASFEEEAGEGDQTPETSEEDLELSTDIGKMLFGAAAGGGGQYGGVGRGAPSAASASLSTPTMANAPSVYAPKATPRIISLSAAPRHRAFAAEAKSSAATKSGSSQGLTLPPMQPRRQPKGQPMEFKEVNFQARQNSRTRKDAMSKLCASPRAASFGGNGLSFGARIAGAQLS